MQTILVWGLQIAVVAFGVVALFGVLRWTALALREGRERWAARVALGMLLLAGVYVAGHARLLAQREELEAGREQYARFGDPRRAEQRRGELRGWVLDCTGEDQNALARYAVKEGIPERSYPLGNATVNLIGGGGDRGERDFALERLYAEDLREPRSFLEAGQLHPVGTDLQLTLCSAPTREAWRLLRASGRPGAVVAQDVRTGAVVAYAATGDADDAPYGIRRYAPPGSVFKMALAALWFEQGMGDDQPIPCPSSIQVGNRSISNARGRAYGVVRGATGMLVPSCNTAAIQMAQQLRQRAGTQAFVEAYRRYGFLPYEPGARAPREDERPFWSTSSEAWTARMTPPPARIKIGDKTGRFEWALLAIGQGPVDVTPIQVSRFMQAIANGGVMLPPTLEAGLARRPPAGERIMREEIATRLQQSMLAIVDGGTGRRAGELLTPTGWDVGGKTGTAELYQRPDDGWFAGIVYDAERRPRYTIVTYLQGGGPGSQGPTEISGAVARVLAGAPRVGALPSLPVRPQRGR